MSKSSRVCDGGYEVCVGALLSSVGDVPVGRGGATLRLVWAYAHTEISKPIYFFISFCSI